MERLEQLQARTERIERELESVVRRLATIEERLRAASLPGAEPAIATPPPTDAEDDGRAPDLDAVWRPGGLLPLAGRSLLVLAGAYLLRAITDGGSVSARLGSTVGLAYAATWLLLADRVARRDARSATVHALVATAIGCPLVWEATTRLGGFGPIGGAVALGVFFALGLAVAARRDLHEVAWVVTVGCALVAVVLGFGTMRRLVYIDLLFAMVAALEVAAVPRRWLALRSPVALALDVLLLELAALVADPSGLPDGFPALSPSVALLAELALPAVYLAAMGVQTAARGRRVDVVLIVQAPLAVAIGLLGAARVSPVAGVSPLVAGGAAIALGGASLVAAFAAERARESLRNVHLYGALGALFTLSAVAALPVPEARALTWSALGLVSASLAPRLDGQMLLQAALWLGAAAWSSGLVAGTRDALLLPATRAWGPVPPVAWATALAIGLAYALMVRALRRGGDGERDLSRVARTLVAVVVVAVALGFGARALAGLAASSGGDAPFDAARLATARTVASAALIVLVAWAARALGRGELRGLVYPLLGLASVKALAEDLPHGRPMTMSISLLALGGAYLAASRLLRRAQ